MAARKPTVYVDYSYSPPRVVKVKEEVLRKVARKQVRKKTAKKKTAKKKTAKKTVRRATDKELGLSTPLKKRT